MRLHKKVENVFVGLLVQHLNKQDDNFVILAGDFNAKRDVTLDIPRKTLSLLLLTSRLGSDILENTRNINQQDFSFFSAHNNSSSRNNEIFVCLTEF